MILVLSALNCKILGLLLLVSKFYVSKRNVGKASVRIVPGRTWFLPTRAQDLALSQITSLVITTQSHWAWGGFQPYPDGVWKDTSPREAKAITRLEIVSAQDKPSGSIYLSSKEWEIFSKCLSKFLYTLCFTCSFLSNPLEKNYFCLADQPPLEYRRGGGGASFNWGFPLHLHLPFYPGWSPRRDPPQLSLHQTGLLHHSI